MLALDKTLLPFDDTGYFSNIVLDYLSRNKKLKDFYNYFPDISSFKQAIQDKKKQSINRELLVEVLKDQNSPSPALPPAGGEGESSHKNPTPGIKYQEYKKVLYNINALKNENTFTVATGHQLCLFMGPLYFVYKIISTINLAEELKKAYPGYNFVPLYWMVSEDHDFEEISHIHLFGKTLKWDQVNKGAVGKMSSSSLEPVLKELKTILGDSEYAKELYDLFQKTYLGHSDLSDATRYLVNELFGQYGLVIIDGDDKRLKNEFRPVIEDDIFNNTAFQLVNSTNKKLSKHYKTQVNPREINIFYLREHLRERVIKSPLEGGSPDLSGQGDVSHLEGDKERVFRVMNTDISFTGQELIEELKIHPERFSPNVVLRPLYQEKILPNLAMIGGGAELAYWLQLKSVFEHYKINYPILILRNSVLLIDKNTNTRLNKLGIQPMQLFNDTDRLIKSYLKRTSPDYIGTGETVLSLDSEKEKITGVFKDILLKAERTDNSLKATVEAELQKQLKGLATIESKLLRAEKRKQETNVNQIKKIKEKLFPGDILQERHDNFIPYYLKYGKEFIAKLKRELNPFKSSFIIFEER